MLNSKKYEKDTIVSFKVVNGDEIIAKIVEENDQGFVLSKPCTVMPSQQGIGLIQSLFTGDLENSSVLLSRSHIIIHAPAIKDIEAHYLKTTTGIEPVSAGGIVT